VLSAPGEAPAPSRIATYSSSSTLSNGALDVDGSAEVAAAGRRRDQISSLAGFLTSDAAGRRKVPFKAIDLTMFCSAENAQAFHVFKTGRGASTGSNAGITKTDADLMTFAGSLFATDGFMRQSGVFAKRLGLSPAGWQKRCDSLHERYRKLGADLRKNAVAGRGDFETVLSRPDGCGEPAHSSDAAGRRSHPPGCRKVS